MTEESKYSVAELEAMLAAAKADESHEEFPKWIEPHASYVDRTNGHVSTPSFPHFHVDRDGKVTVLVADQAEADKAMRELVKEAKEVLQSQQAG